MKPTAIRTAENLRAVAEELRNGLVTKAFEESTGISHPAVGRRHAPWPGNCLHIPQRLPFDWPLTS